MKDGNKIKHPAHSRDLFMCKTICIFVILLITNLLSRKALANNSCILVDPNMSRARHRTATATRECICQFRSECVMFIHDDDYNFKLILFVVLFLLLLSLVSGDLHKAIKSKRCLILQRFFLLSLR